MQRTKDKNQVNKLKSSVKETKHYKKNINIDFSLIGLFVVVLFIIFVRCRLLSFPLERDEGEYAYLGQLILKGYPPYTLAYNMKFPGIYYMFAIIISIFGQTANGIHFGLMLVNITTIVFIYIITKKLLNSFSALIAAITYSILSTSYDVLGQAAHANHFVTFFGIIGIYFLLKGFQNSKWYWYFITGILMSLSLLMKQSGFSFSLFAVLGIIIYYFKNRKFKNLIFNLIYYSLGFIIPLLITIFIFYSYGILNKFLFWTIIYTKQYGTQIPLNKATELLNIMLPVVTKNFVIIWVLFLIGFPIIFLYKKIKELKWILFTFIILGILSVIPGFYFRNHYFITLLPAIAIVIGILFDYIGTSLIPKLTQLKYISFCIFLVIMIIGIGEQKDYFFEKSPYTLCGTVYNGNPFVESTYIADFIKSKTNDEDKVLILGSEPEIYFYSKRLSATPYIYMYDLMYDNEFALSMQKELVNDAEKSKPKIIVFVNSYISWFFSEKSNKYIFNWLNNFLKNNNYKLVGVIDLLGTNYSEYKWNEEALTYKIQNPKNHIVIFEKL